jgi:cytochrome b561
MASWIERSRSDVAGNRYARPMRWLHWISAAVIIWATISGFGAAGLEPDDPARHAIAQFNVALTAAFLPLFFLRLVLKLALPSPPPLVPAGPERQLARLAHGAMYLIILVVMVSGLLSVEPGKFTIIPDFLTIAMPATTRANIMVFHMNACRVLGLLVILHIAAVFWHITKGRPVLERMMPVKNSDLMEAQ